VGCYFVGSNNSGANDASDGGALATTWKVKGGLSGAIYVMWQSSKVSFPLVENTGVALGTTILVAKIGGAVSAVMSST
jgi:hypothetical protein